MSCKIQLSNTSGFYLAGSVIMGQVICNFKNSEDIQTISIKLEGKEHVYWWQAKTSYSGKNTFLLDTKLLASAGRMPSGSFGFPFTFILPDNIPSSFLGPYGILMYSLKAKVHRRFGFDYTDKAAISVLSHLSADKVPDRSLLKPETFDAEKTICCWCLSGGQIYMEAYLENRVIQQGDKIKVALRISNNSNQRIKKVRMQFASFVQSQIKDGDYSIEDKTVVAKTEEDGFEAHNEKHYEISLDIPASADVPNFENAKMFTSRSRLEIIAVLPAFHLNLNLFIPTFFANSPLDLPEGDTKISEEMDMEMLALVAQLLKNRENRGLKSDSQEKQIAI